MFRFLLVAAFVAASTATNSYVVLAPSKLRPGMDYSVSVNVLQATGDVSVIASVMRTTDNTQVSTGTATISKGHPGTIDLQIPADLKTGSYELHVAGSGGLTFKNQTRVTFSAKAMSVYVQTDKAMYKPGQIVNFRVLGVYPDLKVFTGQMDVEIYDPNSNKIKQWIGVTGDKGVFTQTLPLSTQPVQGDWKIKVTAGGATEEKPFTVAEYVLPKFEVTVELPSYALENSDSVLVTVTAKYTYGEPVAGPVVVEAEMTNYYLHSGTPKVQHTATLDKAGRAQLTFPVSELKQQYSNNLNGHTLNFTANVTEALTGITRSGASTVQFYSQGVKLEFLTSNPSTFKPGLDFIAYLKVSQPDGLPVAVTANHKVAVTTSVTAQLVESTTPYQYYMPRTMNFDLAPQTLNLPDNGLVAIQLTVPDNATSLNVHATFDGVSAYSTISKSYSPSDNYMQLFLRSNNRLTPGHQMHFEVKATEAMNELVYQVLSRGSIVAAGSVNARGTTSHSFSVNVEASMAPNARIVLYYVRADGEIVTDSISFDVDGAFQNQVSISMNRAEAEPADSVDVTVHATPQSTAYLLAVDQSVLLLKSGNDITANMVIDELKTFDTISNPSHPIDNFPMFGGGAAGPVAARRKRMAFWWGYPRYYGGSDANQIFTNAGVLVMTDANVYQYVQPYYRRRPTGWFWGGGSDDDDGPQLLKSLSNAPEDSGPPLQEVQHVRNVFPETWLWTNKSTGADGTATISTTVPDTITSWVASAFAVSPTAGLGVSSDTAKLKVFRPFFVSLNLPYSVVRGEQVVLQAIVFNYMQTDQDVRVTLAQSQDFSNIVHVNGAEVHRHEDTAINVHVRAGEGKSVYFPIVPAGLGNIELVVSAQSTQAADAVRRNLLVEAEGVPKEYNVAVLVDLKNTSSFTRDVTLTLPPNVVAGSQRARVTAIGDLMGPSVSGLDKLLQMPTGCGEQNMIGMAPDVFVSSYLKATNQLSSDIAEKAIGFMEQGYQRELTYQHKDGSFSAFGDQDDSGSMWLTAFVVKTFHQAKAYIFIDDQLIAKAIDWMLAKQSADGSFGEPGRVIHKDMQGGSATGPGLTAFVLIALLENNDLHGSISTRVADAQTKAIAYLKQQLPTLTDDYILALTTYALTLAHDASSRTAFATLQSHAVVEGGFKYWHKATTQTDQTTYWQRPSGAGARDVEMTSYALLTYAADNNFIGGLDVMKWVASQRNPNGGYSSTQDTILALQALSEFARLAYSNNFNIQVDVTAASFSKHFTINQANALVLQSAEMSSIPQTVTVAATGSGIALVEIGVFFNVEAEVEEPKFQITTRLLKDTINLIQIEACAKWLAAGTSGMAVQEVGVPSGFEVDLESLTDLATLKRTETQNRKLVLYFDEITAIPTCVRMDIVRTGLVAKSQPVAVRVYDYYDPDNQATAFWESAVLKSSSVCDVCADCCSAPGGK